MATTKVIADHVLQIKERLQQLFSGNNWSTNSPIVQTLGGHAPALSVDSIGILADSVASRIRRLTKAELAKGGLADFLASVPAQVDALNIPSLQNDPDAVVGGTIGLLLATWSQLPPEPLPSPEIDWEQIKDTTSLPKDLARRLRSLESKLKDLEPRAATVDQKINDIEAAHVAAEQLPTDLQDLEEKRVALTNTVEDAGKLSSKIGEVSDRATGFLTKIEAARAKADDLITRSEQALRGATGVGLAAAFEKRKTALTIAGVFWTAGLLAALVAAIFIGAERVEALKVVLNEDKSATVIWVNALLTVLGIGAPIWFAWLSTKQIWTNFRLAEDYAFKSAVSKAYEGYRAEAIDIDENLRARLFDSALTRLEESPIRLLDKETHSSPLQEIINNPNLRTALERVPGIVDKIRGLVPDQVASVAGRAGRATK